MKVCGPEAVGGYPGGKVCGPEAVGVRPDAAGGAGEAVSVTLHLRLRHCFLSYSLQLPNGILIWADFYAA